MKIAFLNTLKTLASIIILFCTSISVSGNSLEKKLEIIHSYQQNNIDSALILLNRTYNEYEREGTDWELAQIYENYALIYAKKEENRKALEYYLQAKEKYESIDSLKSAALLYADIGVIYFLMGEYDKATDAYMEGLKSAEKFNNKKSLARCYQNMGMLYTEIGDNNRALKYYNKALKLSYEIPDNKTNIAGILQNLGCEYSVQGQPDSAISFYKKSLSIFKELNETVKIAITYNNLGVLYEQMDYSDSTIANYKKALDIFYEIDYKRGISISLYNIGQTYRNIGEYNLALDYVYQGLKMAEEINLKKQIQNSYHELSGIYEEKGDFEKSHEYMVLAYNWKDTLFTIEQANQITELETKYETEKKEQHILLQETKLKQTKLRNIALSGISILGIVLTLIIYINLRNKKKLNSQLRDMNQQLAYRHQQFTNSITYASFIQAAILPPLDHFKEFFPETFVLFRPKDSVSGDFYWITKRGQEIMLAIADCTGHGVPGAFMSMLGMTFLNEIINNSGEKDTGKTLDILRERIIDALRQKNKLNDTRDGMDIALCSINMENKTLKYSGAYLPIFIATKGQFIKLEPNRMPIGYHNLRKGHFISQNYQLQKDDVIYIYTDGLPDQCGGDKNKKFSSRQLNEILKQNCNLPLEEQKKSVEKALTDWMVQKEQIDDITLVGLKI